MPGMQGVSTLELQCQCRNVLQPLPYSPRICLPTTASRRAQSTAEDHAVLKYIWAGWAVCGQTTLASYVVYGCHSFSGVVHAADACSRDAGCTLAIPISSTKCTSDRKWKCRSKFTDAANRSDMKLFLHSLQMQRRFTTAAFNT